MRRCSTLGHYVVGLRTDRCRHAPGGLTMADAEREYRARSAPIGDDETRELIIDGWETK